MIFIQENNTEQINNYCKLSGLRVRYHAIKQYKIKMESRLSQDKIPEIKKVGVCCTSVWSDEKGSYSMTIKRLPGGHWVLLSAGGEPLLALPLTN